MCFLLHTMCVCVSIQLYLLSKVVYCGPAKVGTQVAAAKVTVLIQEDVHQGWPEISCTLSRQAAKL